MIPMLTRSWLSADFVLVYFHISKDHLPNKLHVTFCRQARCGVLENTRNVNDTKMFLIRFCNL